MKDMPIRHVLYTHYGAYEESDFHDYRENNNIPMNDFRGVRHLVEHFRGLKELLTTPGHEGLLVMFYAPGFADFLGGVASGKDQKALLEASERLRFAKTIADGVRDLLQEAHLEDRVRFVTALDLAVIFGQTNAILAEEFQRYFVGPAQAQGIRYDTPKIVEAILRLRLLGNGVPVLRLDHDVIFRFGAGVKVIGDLGLFKAVACSSRAYHLRLSDPTVSTFLFSASYNARELMNSASEMGRFEAWSRAFATRVFPSLVVDLDALDKATAEVNSAQRKASEEHGRGSKAEQAVVDEVQTKAWGEYAEDNLDESLVRRFFWSQGRSDGVGV